MYVFACAFALARVDEELLSFFFVKQADSALSFHIGLFGSNGLTNQIKRSWFLLCHDYMLSEWYMKEMPTLTLDLSVVNMELLL